MLHSMDKLVRIGTRIRQARLDAHATQQSLADAVGVTLTAVQKWEGGQREPSFATLHRLSAVLHVSQSWLLGEGETVSEDDRLARLERELRALRALLEERLPPR